MKQHKVANRQKDVQAQPEKVAVMHNGKIRMVLRSDYEASHRAA
jgi:hypothetical protein